MSERSSTPGWVQDALADGAIEQVGWVKVEAYGPGTITEFWTMDDEAHDGVPCFIVTQSDESTPRVEQ